MNPNHGIRSDETGATKGPPQQHGSVSRSKDSHATRLLNYLTKNLTPQRSPGQNPTTSTLGNDGAGWRPLDGPNSLSMAPLWTTLGKTLAKHVSRPPPEPQPPPWPPPLRPWPPWPAINLSAAPRFSTLPAEVTLVAHCSYPQVFLKPSRMPLRLPSPQPPYPPKKQPTAPPKVVRQRWDGLRKPGLTINSIHISTPSHNYHRPFGYHHGHHHHPSRGRT